MLPYSNSLSQYSIAQSLRPPTWSLLIPCPPMPSATAKSLLFPHPREIHASPSSLSCYLDSLVMWIVTWFSFTDSDHLSPKILLNTQSSFRRKSTQVSTVELFSYLWNIVFEEYTCLECAMRELHSYLLTFVVPSFSRHVCIYVCVLVCMRVGGDCEGELVCVSSFVGSSENNFQELILALCLVKPRSLFFLFLHRVPTAVLLLSSLCILSQRRSSGIFSPLCLASDLMWVLGTHLGKPCTDRAMTSALFHYYFPFFTVKCIFGYSDSNAVFIGCLFRM